MIFTCPFGVTMMLSDLMSRCTMPFSCAAASPSHAWIATSSTFLIVSESRATAFFSVFPSTNSIERYTWVSNSPISKMTATFGCISAEAARASW